MHKSHGSEGAHGNMNYRHLAIMVVLSFISMYVFMYAMVDTFANVFMSFNQVYMRRWRGFCSPSPCC